MRIVCCRIPFVAHLFTAAVVFTCGGTIRALADDPMGKALVGSWECRGKVIVFSADGTGKNHDASRFRWELKEGRLIAHSQKPDGKLGNAWSVPIVFTKDQKEYCYLTGAEDGDGMQRVTFHKLDPDGRHFERRTEADRAYPPNAEALKGEEPPEEGETPKPQPNPVRLAPATLSSGEAIIRVGPNVHVSKANAEILHAEVVLAADPADSKRLVAASMYAPPPVDPAAPKIIVYASADGGKNWAPTLKRKDANPTCIADPAFAWATPDSLFFINMWSPSMDQLQDAGCLQVVRSRDGGITWGPTTTVKGYQDRPFLARDHTKGKYKGRLYCLTHKGLQVSTDSGQSFGPLRTWPRRPDYFPYGSGNPLVGSDGTLVVIYNNSTKRETEAQQQGDPDLDQRYLASAPPRDGGDSFSDEVVVAEYHGDGLAMAAASPAHVPWRDRVYIVWQGVVPGRHRCVSFAHSKDRGATFSKPMVLSEQSTAQRAYDAFVPSIAVNNAGVVAVTWYDTRGFEQDNAGWNLRLRASLDGGETWHPSVSVTDVPTLKDKQPRKRLPGVGHTGGLAADADGVFHCLWVDGRSGVFQVYTATAAAKPPSEL